MKQLVAGFVGLAVCGFALASAGAQSTSGAGALEARVKAFLEANRGGWRDMNVPESDGQLLHDLVVKGGYTRALEIGTSTGRSGIWIALALSKTGGKLTTIDIDEGRHREAVRNFKEAGVSAFIDARLADAHELVPKLDGPFDFVFIDADKDWYTNYAKAVIPKLAVGGCIAAHNVYPGTRPARRRDDRRLLRVRVGAAVPGNHGHAGRRGHQLQAAGEIVPGRLVEATLQPRRDSRSARPVCDASHAATASGVPATTSWPPPGPPSGPRSMTQSARAMTSRLCSTASTVWPASTSRSKIPSRRSHVVRVQAGGRLVAQVERAAAAARDERGGEREPLPFAAGQRAHRLADAEVAEPDVAEGVERLHRCRATVHQRQPRPTTWPRRRSSRARRRWSARPRGMTARAARIAFRRSPRRSSRRPAGSPC